GLVQNEDWRVLEDGAGNRDALALAARQAQATLTDDGLVAVRHLRDEIVGKSGAGRRLDGFLRDMRLTISDVVAHRVVEQHRFLRDDADLRAQRGKGHIADIVTVDLQTAGSQIEEARNKVDESALPGATGAYDGEHLTPLHFKIDGAEDVAGAFLIPVREACAFEYDAPGERRQRLGSRLLADIIFTLGE